MEGWRRPIWALPRGLGGTKAAPSKPRISGSGLWQSCRMAELDSQPKSIQSLYSWFVEDKLFVNRRYQRKLVWTLVEKQRLIESILRKFPIPAILIAEREGGTYEIIDGLQRLHTMVSFIETSFPTLDGQFFDVSQFPTANSRAAAGFFEAVPEPLISVKEVSTILDYSMAISVMRGASEEEIDDVFARINTYGHRLSDQERRQAGVQDSFSNLIRELACQIRGDASSDILGLAQMPSISVDLPMTKHGYSVIADEVYWIQEGILRSTDLRDSMDEQCLADITACIIGGQIIDRSKDALDSIYEAGSSENSRVSSALDTYGAEKFASELKYCIDELLKVCEVDTPTKLRTIIFDGPSTNAFPAVFALLMIALHQSLIRDGKRISDYTGVRTALSGLYSRLDTGRRSTAIEERQKNIDTIKGLIAPYLVNGSAPDIYRANSTTDIESTIRRSAIELPHYELKQGLLSLGSTRLFDGGVVEKVIKTICAIANNGKERTGAILIGVTDKDTDAARVTALDGVVPRKVGTRSVVGITREAQALGETTEQYFSRLRDGIRDSGLSQPLKDEVLSSIDYNDYYGLGVVVISIPAQDELSFVDGDAYWRRGDETIKAEDAVKVTELNRRFR